jgi:hypothetical protein
LRRPRNPKTRFKSLRLKGRRGVLLLLNFMFRD